MKRIILLTICTTLLLTGCGQTTVPDADTSPTMAQEEAIPATNTQDAPMVAAGAPARSRRKSPHSRNKRPLSHRRENLRSLCQPSRQRQTHPHKRQNPRLMQT